MGPHAPAFSFPHPSERMWLAQKFGACGGDSRKVSELGALNVGYFTHLLPVPRVVIVINCSVYIYTLNEGPMQEFSRDGGSGQVVCINL